MDIVFPGYWFDTTSSKLEELGDSAETDATDKGRKLCCHLCRHPVTDQGQRITFQGEHTHTRTNPAGYSYAFGCYEHAPGCRRLGPRTDDHTWFPGYDWQIVVCGNCGEHLGWLFSGPGKFYGLIVDRIVPEQNQAQ